MADNLTENFVKMKINSREQNPVYTDAIPFTTQINRETELPPSHSGANVNTKNPPRSQKSTPKPKASGPQSPRKQEPLSPAPGTSATPTNILTFNKCSGVQLGDNQVTFITHNLRPPKKPKKNKKQATVSGSNGKNQSTAKDFKSKIPPEILNSTKPIDPEVQLILSEHLGFDWRRLGTILPQPNHFSKGQMDDIQLSNPYSVKNAIVALLEHWRQRAPLQATVGNLADCLGRLGLIHLALKLPRDPPSAPSPSPAPPPLS